MLRQLIERQRRDRRSGGNAYQPRECAHRAASLARLCLDEADDEIEHDIVEFGDVGERQA